MRAVLAPMLVALALAACGEADKAAPVAPQTAGSEASATPVAPTAPAANPASLETACREVVERMYGQTGGAVTYQAVGEGRAEVSWRAPVDGGVLSFECRADADRVGLYREGREVTVNVQPAGAPAEQEAR